MITFLTSSFIEYQKPENYKPVPLMNDNGFVENLKTCWKDNSRFLMITSDPDDEKLTDHMAGELSDEFALSGFLISQMRILDRRAIREYAKEHNVDEVSAAKAAAASFVAWADVIFLAGGHGPTENAFIKECDLRGALGIDLPDKERKFGGIFIGLSAGSVNSADEAYLIPELPGESVRDDYVRYTKGLGLTSIQIIPHYQFLKKGVVLDGQYLVQDIISKDSMGRRFYLIPDGSYFVINEGVTELFGEAEVIQDGIIKRIPQGIIHSRQPLFKDKPEAYKGMVDDISHSFLYNNYEFILTCDENFGNVHFYYMSEFLLENGFVPVFFDSFNELNRTLSEKLVEQDEKQAYLDQIDTKTVLEEIKRDGEYVRTIHLDTQGGIEAEKVTVRAIGRAFISQDSPEEEKTQCRLLCTMVNTSSILSHDWMTDVYSRSGFLTEAAGIIKYRKPGLKLSLVYANIQGFKAINDLFGSFIGDMVIFQMRDEIRRIMKPEIMARLEADHYVFIAESANLNEKTLNEFCNQVYRRDFTEYPFQIRCGVFNITGDAANVSTMIDCAKLAENSISNNRGNLHAVYDEKIRKDYIEQRVFVSELDSALSRGEFITYYQPVVDIKSKKIVSAEALVRWNHHKYGMLPPGRFVPAFEQGGLITRIDYMMVDNVLKFNMKRRDEGKNVVPCAVNLSRVDFYDSRLIENIMTRLHGSAGIQDMLKLEVTESAYAELEDNALDFLTEIKSLGMSVLLDDFGSGMSSMSTLESFEFDIVKLDMGFARKIGRSRKAEAIIKSVIELSHAVGARVVAEGVEVKEQLDFLEAAGCDMVQGYYFYKPMSEEQFSAILEK